MKIINFIKKLFFGAIRWCIRIANIIGIIIFIFLSILLYFIIFEVPIKFLNKYVEQSVFNNLFKVEKVYLKWDYNIKKPVFILKNISYNNHQDMSLGFNSLGVAFDVRKLLYNHHFYPIYINASGFEVSGIRYKDNTFSFDLDKGKNNDIERLINTFNNPKDKYTKSEVKASKKESSILNSITFANLQKYGLLNFFEQHVTKYNYLELLENIDLDSSTVKLKDEVKSQDFILHINNIHINYDKSHRKMLVTTNAYLKNKKSNQNIYVNGNIDINNDNAYFNYNINNVPPNLILLYSELNNKEKVRTAGISISTSMEGRYSFKEGIKSISASINTSEGEVFVENVLSDKVKINSIKSKVRYKSSNNTIIISNFEVNLANNSFIKLTGLKGGAIPIRKAVFDSNIDIKNNFYNFYNIKVNILNYLVTGDVNYKQGDIKFQLINNNKVTASSLKYIWPDQLLPETKKWIVNNVKRGNLQKIYITGDASINTNNAKLNNVNGNALISNAEVNYVDGMPTAFVSNATLSFDNKHLKIAYNNGKAGTISSNYGEVGLYNEFPNKKTFSPVIKVDLSAQSNVKEVLLFINNKPLNLIDKVSFLKNTKIEGNVAGKVYLEYSFFKHKVQNLDIEILGHDIDFFKIFNNQDLNKADLKLNIKDNGLSIYGTGDYYNIPINLYLNGYWNSKLPYTTSLNIDGKDVSIEKLNKLRLLPNLIKNNLSGITDLSVNMQQLKNSNKQLFNINLDLTNTKVDNILFTGYSKPVKKPLNAVVNFTLEANKLTEIQKLYMYNNEASVQMKLKFSDPNTTNIVIDSFMLKDKADVTGNINISKNTFNINLSGKYLNFKELLDVYEKNKANYKKVIYVEELNNNSLSNKVNNSDIKNQNNKSYNIKLDVKKVESNNVVMNDFYLNFGMSKKDIKNLVFSGDFDKYNGITLVYDKNTKQIAYNVSNLGNTLTFLNVSTNIKRGNLNGNIFLTKDNNDNAFSDGRILLKSFSVGIIPFSSATVAFTGKNLDFNIINFIIKGNVLGGSMSGNYTFDNNNLLLTGYLTPIWSTSQILVKIPLLGDFLRSNFAQSILSFGVSKNNKDKANRGAVNIPFSIYGPLNKLQYGVTKLVQTEEINKKITSNESNITSKSTSNYQELLNPFYNQDNTENIFSNNKLD